ncbi:helix-turn-helix domain-containing protein [Streptomyces sp. C10-9-1]|uniref:helix-turn-helix domain-containing protein n=1 Tax=Streptomyces sp. C10-9-1 TaxID=1859285 RepID=UPI003D71F409
MYRERPSRLPGAVAWTVSPGDGPGREPRPILPDGCMDLLWSEGVLRVAGPDTHAHTAAPGAAWSGLRLAPGAAPALLGVPAHALRDLRVELADLWGAATARRLAARIDPGDPALGLEDLALSRAADGPAPEPWIAPVVRHLAEGGSVARAGEAVGLAPRRLHRRSLEAFGYGPKTLARILRLQRALALVRGGTSYAEAAHRAGCADQAHLARETKALAGMTLGAYEASAKSDTAMPSGSSTRA